MSCSNCFNGCKDIVPDQCVKYTGIAIPGLGINPGDTLLIVENQIINKILEIVSGNGVIPTITSSDLCSLVSGFLPSSGTISLNDVISALFRSICALDTRLQTAENSLVTLNANYVIGCLSGVTSTSGTHDILQATITKLCLVNTDVTTLSAELTANYVLISDINSYIAAYLAGIPSSSLYNSKMIPYVAVPYFGSTVGFFDITGAGIGDWIKIYLCNGQNSTPDLRGRVIVGATTMGNTAFNPAVDPSIAGNPSYAPNTLAGTNLVKLTDANQLPPHTHTGTTSSEGEHVHTLSTIRNYTNSFGVNGFYDRSNNYSNAGLSTDSAGAHTHNFLTNSTGASEGHNNIQPVHATNFIIYIP